MERGRPSKNGCFNFKRKREREPSLSKIVEKSELDKEARETVKKIKEVFPGQLFSVPIQAAVGGKIIARETVKAKRKDVTAPLYGGDVTRKMKLLKKQKKGKKKLASKAKLSVPSEVIIELLKE
jgi:GTP-binding protein LepA